MAAKKKCEPPLKKARILTCVPAQSSNDPSAAKRCTAE